MSVLAVLLLAVQAPEAHFAPFPGEWPDELWTVSPIPGRTWTCDVEQRDGTTYRLVGTADGIPAQRSIESPSRIPPTRVTIEPSNSHPFGGAYQAGYSPVGTWTYHFGAMKDSRRYQFALSLFRSGTVGTLNIFEFTRGTAAAHALGYCQTTPQRLGRG